MEEYTDSDLPNQTKVETRGTIIDVDLESRTDWNKFSGNLNENEGKT